MFGIYSPTPRTIRPGESGQVAVDQHGQLLGSLTVVSDSVAVTKTTVVGTSASAPLLAADATRSVVRVRSTATNDSAAVDPTGGTCALDSGDPIQPGGGIEYTGVSAQSAMTFFATTGNKLTVFTG